MEIGVQDALWEAKLFRVKERNTEVFFFLFYRYAIPETISDDFSTPIIRKIVLKTKLPFYTSPADKYGIAKV